MAKKDKNLWAKSEKKIFFIQTHIRSFQYFYIHKIIKKGKSGVILITEKKENRKDRKRRDCLM